MASTDPGQDERYRILIDALVDECRAGQGQIRARHVREGVWNQNASEYFLGEQHRVNLLLATLSPDQRETLARLLVDEYAAGVFGALVALYEAEIPPFDKSYEGTPYNDFVGRLQDWEWPLDQERTE